MQWGVERVGPPSAVGPATRLTRLPLIAASESLRQNTPETIARLSGGEYLTLGEQRFVERDLPSSLIICLPPRAQFSASQPAYRIHTLTLRLRDQPNLSLKSRRGILGR